LRRGADIDGKASGDRSGISASLSDNGTILAIGANQNGGHVRVFAWDGSVWSQIGADIDGEAAGDEFGFHLSISSDGSILVVGAPSNDGNGLNSGHVRVFTFP